MKQLVNLEQIRARNAFADPGVAVRRNDKEGDNLSGYPSLIVNNGFLATLAFSLDKKGQHKRIADALAFHLDERGIVRAGDSESLLKALSRSDSGTLRRATTEALAFLAYLKRFHRSPL